MRTKCASLAALALSLLLGACGPAPRRADPAAPLTLTEESSGQRFDVEVGQEVIVRLASNRTTGYQWTLADSRSALMAVVGEPQYEPPAQTHLGVGGTETWRLKAMTKGQVALVFEYRRPLDKVLPPARTASFTFLAR
jgi:predicted secreted protein